MDTKKALELIQKYTYIGLLLPRNPSFDCLSAAEALCRFLEEQDKVIGVLGEVSLRQEWRDSFMKLAASPLLPKEFIVSVDTLTSPLSQLRYEKQENRIDIILSPKTTKVEERSISFREGKLQCECIIALGTPDIETAAEISGASAALFNEVINLDINADNRRYGETNIVEPGGSLAELSWRLMSASPGYTLTPSVATLLLGGILAQTDGLKNVASADTMTAAAALMREGADHQAARRLTHESAPLPLLQLFSRASVRSKSDAKRSVLWSFLTEEDFTKTGRTAADASAVLDHLVSALPRHTANALLWQDPASQRVRTSLAAAPEILQTIHTKEGGAFQSPYLRLSNEFASFREAEDFTDSLLATVL